MWLLHKIMNTIVVNNVYRKIGELLIIIIKFSGLGPRRFGQKPPFRVQKEISLYLCKYKSNS